MTASSGLCSIISYTSRVSAAVVLFFPFSLFPHCKKKGGGGFPSFRYSYDETCMLTEIDPLFDHCSIFCCKSSGVVDSGIFCPLLILKKKRKRKEKDQEFRNQTSSRSQTHVNGAIMEMAIEYDNTTVQ